MAMFEKRNVVGCIILSLVTCGIYAIIWEYKLLSDMYRMNNMPSKAGIDILLGFVTCGIYTIYVFYKLGQLESQVHSTYGLPPKNDSLIYLILGIFTVTLVPFAMLQNNINNTLADAVAHAQGSGNVYGHEYENNNNNNRQ